MDLIFLVILGAIGIAGLVKGQIKISKNKALKGTKARTLSVILILAGVQLVVRDYMVRNSPGAGDASFGYLLGTVAVVAVVTILFMVFGQEDIGPVA
ncbi:MAG TPA: hypothetical protein VF974_06510 [Patescibacteria group bacterium]